jgi:hypothetical protein
MIALLALIYIGSLIVGMAIGVCVQAVNKLVSK